MNKSRVQVKCPSCSTSFLPSLETIQSQAGKSSRAKGANFERNLAKKFAKWWPGNYEFKRTPMSGGSVLKIGWDMAGDITTNAPDFKLHIEAKNAPGSFAGLHQLFTRPDGPLFKWAQQAQEDCPKHRTPLLIVNRFDQPTYCMMKDNWCLYLPDILRELNLNQFTYRDRVHGKFTIWFLEEMLAADYRPWMKLYVEPTSSNSS